MSNQYEDYEQFEEAVDNGIEIPEIIQDAHANPWMIWQNEDGDVFGTRPRGEDDGYGPDDDPYRPLGPVALESLDFPIIAGTVKWEANK